MFALRPCAVLESMTFLKVQKDCCGAMQRNFIRISARVECDMGVPLNWLRGRSPVTPLRVSKARWGHRVVLCRAEPTIMLTPRWTAYARSHQGHWIAARRKCAPPGGGRQACSGRGPPALGCMVSVC